ncbi:NAD(P)H-quinone oxidoreductase [Pararhodonellum marinum]|uniref:NAD(P)H-quinone oxidoreductase n=1 Tax=Pararhodonellum marinum TaxID=2755358 RepID=UPI0018902335|nr:NAD(P)H-quinone oxidoreductase [Pararhodonellum marinum]
MKAIVISEPGEAEVLILKTVDKPKPKKKEVLIKVAAAGVNRPDIAQRKGHYPAPPDAPADIPGLEVSGTIASFGESVKNWEVGDAVCALVSGGGYADYVLAPAAQCLPLPEDVDLVEAAAIPETFFTVWNNVFDIGQFKAGETVLIHGGSSGIGAAAIQMVKALGGRVVITAGSEEKCDFCRKLGADLAINYKLEDFEKAIKESSKITGIDIVLGMIGGDYTPKNLNLLNPNGRLIMINAMKGREATVDLIKIMVKRLTITGSTLRPQSIAYKGQIAKNLMIHIWPHFPNKIKPIVYKTFPLSEASEAHKLMESSSHMGKILLIP